MSEIVRAQTTAQMLQHIEKLTPMPFGQIFKEIQMSNSQSIVVGASVVAKPLNAISNEQKSTAYNALKSGVYSNSLMPWESEAEVEAASERLCNEFEIQGLAGYVLARQFVHTTLQIARLERSQAILIANVLKKKSARAEFAEQAGLGNVPVEKIPDWYFSLEPKDHQRAAYRRKCLIQARHLRDNHSADLMSKVQSVYPELWELVMEPGSGSRTRVYTFGEWITRLYGHPKPVENLNALVDKLAEDFKFDIIWYSNEERYKAILSSVQAKAEIDVTSDPNQLRASSMLQRKLQGLLIQLSEHRKLAALEARCVKVSPIQIQGIQSDKGTQGDTK